MRPRESRPTERISISFVGPSWRRRRQAACARRLLLGRFATPVSTVLLLATISGCTLRPTLQKLDPDVAHWVSYAFNNDAQVVALEPSSIL
jgi:hypothetical protein